jgi:hypothetical protein
MSARPKLKSLEDMMAAFNPGELERKLQQTSTPKGRIDHFKSIAAKEYPIFTEGLDPYMRQFFADRAATAATAATATAIARQPSEEQSISFPAVDLGAGSAYYTVQWALRYRAPSFEGSPTTTFMLEWYPTDIEDILKQSTRPCLQYMKDEAAKCAFLGMDRNDSPLYPNNRIILQGLSNETYNGNEGSVLRRDPSSQGRYAIKLDGTDNSSQPMSFKRTNLVKKDFPENAVASLEEAHRQLLSIEQGMDAAVYDGLLERSCELDVLQRETWSTLVEKLRGTCALVTCTSLLSAIGYREPDAWKNVMDIATSLLISGGFLMQYDRTNEGHFGHVSVMERYATPLGLTLKNKVGSSRQTFLLWQMR